MRDDQKNKAELLQEMETLRKRVAELRQMEEALRESEKKWRSLLKNTPDIVMIVDRDGAIRFINHTVPGIKEQEAIGKKVYDYISPEHHDTMRKDLERVFQTGQGASHEISGVGPHDSLSWYQAKLGPIRQDGRIVAASIVTRDITEHKRADEEIRTSDERYRDLAERSFDLIFMTDAQGYLTYVSAASEKIFQYKPEKMVGTHFKNYLVKSEIHRVSQRFAENMKGENLGIFQMEAMRKDGGRVFIELNSSPIVKDGAKIGIQGIIRDIAERKRAGEALKKSEQRFRSLVEVTSDWVWEVDKNGIYTYASPKVKELLGYEPQEVIGKTPFDLMPSDEAERVGAIFRDITISRKPFERLENRNLHKDGRLIVLETSGVPILDEGGNLLGYRGIDRDISERKRAEEALKKSEEKYRLLFEGTGTDNTVISVNGVYLMMNEKGAERLGGRPEHFVGKSVYDTFPKDAADEYVKRFRHVAESGETKTYEDLVELPNGNRWFLTNMRSVEEPDGNVTSVQLISQDITDRKKAEDALRESEERYKALFQGAAEGIIVADVETMKYKYVNPAICKMLGYTEEELIRLSVPDIHRREDLEYANSDFKSIARGEKTLTSGIPCLRKDGTIMYADIKAAVVLIDGRQYNVGFFTDVTEIKRAEMELNEYREKMARAERLASVGTLSAEMAHTLNNPLTAIKLSIQNAMAESKKTPRQSTITKYLKEGLRSVSDVSSTVRGLGRFAAESSKEIISEVNLKAVAERIVKLLSESARRTKMSLHLEGMGELPPIYSNEKDLEQLFFSLVENAIHAADGKKSHQLIISGAVKDKHIELRFTDNCGGIASENLDKIFELFFTTNPPGEGTGLGLCIVERIVSGAGGKIRVESKAGKGSTFFVTLPISRGTRY